MNCKKFQLMLDEGIENELDKDKALEAATHSVVCESCSAYYKELRRENNAYARFLMVEPTPALWKNIQAEVETTRRGGASLTNNQSLPHIFRTPHIRPTVVVMIAMLGIVVIVIGLVEYRSSRRDFAPIALSDNSDLDRSWPKAKIDLLLKESNTSEANNKVAPGRRTNKVPRAGIEIGKNNSEIIPSKRTDRPSASKPKKFTVRAPTTERIVEKAERQFISAIAVLSVDLGRRRSQIPTGVTRQFKRSLSEADRRIAATRRTVRKQRTDPIAVHYMTTAYAQKVELLRSILSN